MGKVTLADWIKTNHKEVDRLTKAGILSVSIKQQFAINQQFESNSHIKSRMQRYENVAESMRVSCRTVQEAVKRMNKKI